MADNEVSIGYRFKQQGIEDLTSRIKELHEEFRRGEITYKQYRTEIREATGQGRAATQEFSQMKGAISAANPELLGFTRTMSLFGGVANTVLSIMNAINLAQIAMSGISTQVANIDEQKAAAYNDWVRAVNAYPPNDPRIVAAWNKYIALVNESNLAHRDLAKQSVSTAITLGASAVAIIGSISQTIIGFQALRDMGVLTGANVAAAMGPILLAIGLVAAAFYGLPLLLSAISPQFAKGFSDLKGDIEAAFNLDDIQGQVLSVLILTATGFAEWGDHIQSILNDVKNFFITNFINPIISAWDMTIGKITGQVSQLQTSIYTLSTPQDLINKLLGTSFTNLGGSSADKKLASQGVLPWDKSSSNPITENTTATNLSNTLQQQNNQFIQQMNRNLQQLQGPIDKMATGIQQQNTNSSYQQAISQTQSARQSIQNQINALTAQRTVLPNNIMSMLEQGDSLQAHVDAAAAANAPIDAKIQALQAQLQALEVGSQDLLGGYLGSIGLSSTSGIGSVVAGAVGMGGGITADTINAFIQTHDYGVFTAQAMKDANASAGAFGTNTAYNDYINSLAQMGITGKAATDAAAKAGIKKAASGFSGVVTGPTMFMTGESGPESVNISPLSSSGGHGKGNITIIVQGSLLTESQFAQKIQQILKGDMRRGGFT